MPRLTVLMCCVILLQMNGCSSKSKIDLAGSALRTKIVAHRGASFYAPENTSASFKLAWQQNADAIEGDFYLTADRQIVCIHDKNTKRTSGIDMVVENSTLEQLKAMDVGMWKDPKYSGERMITLSEMLKLVPEDKRVYLELKSGPEIVGPLKRILEESDVKPEQISIISFDADAIAKTRKLLPDIKAFWLTGYKFDKVSRTWSPSIDEVLETLERIDAHGLDSNANQSVVNAQFVKKLRDNRYEFHVWTVDEADVAQYFYELGADSITTNRPDFIRDVFTSTKS